MRLTLFFTSGISLQTWYQQGMIDREIALYQRLQQKGIDITFITYGNKSDRDLAHLIPNIKILCNSWNLPQSKYQRWLHLIHASWLLKTDIIKTNQTNGADIALKTAKFWRKPLIARCGYMWSEFTATQKGQDSPEYQRVNNIETEVFNSAKKVIVTTPMMAEDIKQRIPRASPHTVIIPNYVESDRFCPQDNINIAIGYGEATSPSLAIKPDFDLVFVGRIAPQKNITALLEAIVPLDVSLLVIGNGQLKESLQQKFAHLGDRICWQGNISNRELPNYLHRGKVFILPSHYEGHPKALIEAMSCGLSIIAGNSPGIKEIITHGKNGWLCNTDAESIRNGIQELLAQPQLRAKLGRNAHQYAKDNYALDNIVNTELQLLQQVLAAKK